MHRFAGDDAENIDDSAVQLSTDIDDQEPWPEP